LITKLQFKLEYLTSYIRKNFIFIFVGLFLGSSVFAYRKNIFSFLNSPRFQKISIGVEGLFQTSALPIEVTDLLSDSLVTTSEHNKLIPTNLVSDIKLQEDNKTYLLTLNPATWHDGTKFSAYDINLQISGAEIEAISPNQLKIVTSNSFAPLLAALTKPLFKKNLVGLGPYRLKGVEYQDGYVKTLTLVSVTSQQPTIIYRFYPSDRDLITAFKLGEVDQIKINYLPTEFTNWPKTKITQTIVTNDKYSAIFLNNLKFNNKQIRQALAYATPKTKDKNERCLSPISPDSWAYFPSVKEYLYNPGRAKELMGDNKIDSLNLTVTDRRLLPLAEEIKTAWQENLGINISVSIESQINFDNYDAILAYGGIPLDPDQYPFWHSTQQTTNVTKFNNSRIDKLLEDGRQIIDQQERKLIYQDFQKFLLEESPAIFLSFPTSYTITRTSL
jgi:ABC-type transport system substrate-binding protein